MFSGTDTDKFNLITSIYIYFQRYMFSAFQVDTDSFRWGMKWHYLFSIYLIKFYQRKFISSFPSYLVIQTVSASHSYRKTLVVEVPFLLQRPH